MRAKAVATAIVVVMAAGRSAAPSDQSLSYPTDPQIPIVHIETSGGGPTPPEYLRAANTPDFVLYGDGELLTLVPSHRPRTLVPGHRPPDPTQSLAPAMQLRSLSEAGIEALLAAAADAGLLSDDALDFGDPLWTEAAPVTTIRISAESGTFEQRFPLGSTVSWFEEKPPWNVVQNRLAAQEFLDRLNDLAGWLPEGSVEAPQTASFEQFSVYYGSDSPRLGLPIAWPHEPLPALSDPDNFGCVTIDKAQLETLDQLKAQATPELPVSWSSDAATYRLAIRPVLPHETPCNKLG